MLARLGFDSVVVEPGIGGSPRRAARQWAGHDLRAFQIRACEQTARLRQDYVEPVLGGPVHTKNLIVVTGVESLDREVIGHKSMRICAR